MEAALGRRLTMKNIATPLEFDWRNQFVPVVHWGDQRLLGTVLGGRLYHGTGSALVPGTVLEPGHSKNFRQSGQFVSITSDATRAWYWAYKAGFPREQIHVYEVEALGEVTCWRAGLADCGGWILWEGRVSRARIACEHLNA